jgi:sterol desaturase/sphingolipid hydroxylase (fatty acid hydroxylase superfamily)
LWTRSRLVDTAIRRRSRREDECGHKAWRLLFFEKVELGAGKMEEVISFLSTTWEIVLTKFSYPTSRLHWGNLLLMPFLGVVPYLIYHKTQVIRFNVFEYLKFIFPKREYLSRSALLDYQFFLLNIVLNPVRLVGFVMTPVVGAVIFKTLNQIYTPTWDRLNIETSPVAAACFVLVFFMLNDFSNFLHHYIRHKVRWLWEFHSVHHSAQVLNPLTADRKHPVDLIFENIVFVFCMSIAVGVLAYFTIDNLSVFFLAKVKVAVYIFNLSSNFRHSHVWIPFGPFWSKIFMSPAQHLIHHSCAPEHRDKNNGRILSIWDWMFGTLYVPENEERHGLVLGIDIQQPNYHPNMLVALLDPFRRILRPVAAENITKA